MRVIDLHFYVGTGHRCLPPVMSYPAKTNPEYAGPMSEEIAPDAVIEYLDSQAVDAAVVLPDCASGTGDKPMNDFISGFCNGTDRLIPFCTISLNDRDDPAGRAEHCIRDLGCRGLNLLTPYTHFYPADSRLLPAYEVASAFGIPFMFRTGTCSPEGSPVSHGGNPLLLDDLAKTFPRLDIIMSHGGYPMWCADSERMLYRHKNCFVDTSGIPPRQLTAVFPHLERFRDRFLFGSGWPAVASIAEQVRMIEELPFSSDTIEAILWENGSHLLGVEPRTNRKAG